MVARVLVVVTSDQRRGAEIEGVRLAARLSRRGFVAEVVALAPAGSATRVDAEPLGRSPLGIGTLTSLRRRARRADVVIGYGSTTLPACALALVGTGTPFVYRSIGDPRAWAGGRLRRRRTGWAMRRARAVVALWPGAADAVRELYAVRDVRVIAHPLPELPDPLSRSDARRRFAVPSDAPVVAVIAALSPEKRVDLAGSAVASVARAHLLLVGDGPMRDEILSGLRPVLGDRLHATGSIDDVQDVYAAADAVLLTSVTEGVPGVVLEAMVAGCPVVATDVGGVRWTLESWGRGRVVPVDATPDEVALAVSQAIGSPRPEPRRDDGAAHDASWSTLIGEMAR